MPQTSIAERMTKALQGQITEAGPRFSRSASAEGASVVAGIPVQRGTAPQSQVKPYVAGDLPGLANFAGFVILDTSRAQDALAIEEGDPVAIMRLGCMYVTFSEAVTAGEQVGLTLATGLLTGIAQGVAPPVGIVVLPSVRIVETIGAAGLATVEISLEGAHVEPAPLRLGTLAAFAAGATAVATRPPTGTVYDVPTTAAASTIDLPADAPEGTILHFVADGTKNGHTIQFRDVATAISAALTASKRIAATAIHLNDKWHVTVTVGP